MRPSQTFHVLEELTSYSSAPLYRKGVRLSADDSRVVQEVYQQWLLLLVDIGYLLSDCIKRDFTRLWSDLLQRDVYDLNDAFAECLMVVYHKKSQGFKGLCGRISSHLYNIVKVDYEKMLQGDPFAGRRLIQAFAFTSRLSLNDIDLTQQQLDDYLSIEQTLDWNPSNDPLCHRLNYYIKRWLGKFLVEEIVPQHGPGGVAGLGRCSLEDKYKDLTSDELISYCFPNPVMTEKPIHTKLCRTSQVLFVPKSYKSFRTISMEPTTLQYYQQGVQVAVQDLVEHSSYLRNHIGLRDQTRNQRLAREGSIWRKYATIDLSAASDTVSYELVKHLFRGTWLYRYLVSTRSRYTMLPNGEVIEVKKFAPMGSALCFPIETFVFASICEHVTRVCGVPGDYTVYGDDIVVPTLCVSYLFRTLEQLGFRVNKEKSFFQESCWFRESCGGFYLDGVDVTPLRVSRKYSSRDQRERFTSLMTLCNSCYLKNFRNLRQFYLSKMRFDLKIVPLFAETHLLSDNYTNYHTKIRWNSNLQRLEVRHNDIDTSFDKSISEDIRYLNWLNSSYRRKIVLEAFESRIGRPHAVVKYHWSAKPYESLDQAQIDLHIQSRKNPSSLKGKGRKV